MDTLNMLHLKTDIIRRSYNPDNPEMSLKHILGLILINVHMTSFTCLFSFIFNTLHTLEQYNASFINLDGKLFFFYQINILNALSQMRSLSVSHYELCRDDIGDLPGSPDHL